MNKLIEFTLTVLVMELLMGAGVYQIYSMHQELNIVSIGGIGVIVVLMAAWPFIVREKKGE